MSIRPLALKWLSSNHKGVIEDIYTSKYYQPEESWNKKHVWWIEVPINVIETKSRNDINLICQKSLDENVFYYLQVPKKYFLDNLQLLYIRDEKISIYLSAEKGNLFIEQRGSGKVDFKQFLIS